MFAAACSFCNFQHRHKVWVFSHNYHLLQLISVVFNFEPPEHVDCIRLQYLSVGFTVEVPVEVVEGL